MINNKNILLPSLLFAATIAAEEQGSPNILFIVAEDASPDFGCYGNPYVYTPHIDRLASQGVRFNNAYTTYSVSSPSRGSILTGLYPFQNGQIGLATHKYRMYDSIKTLPEYMSELGYRTACLGKIHVNPESEFPFDYWDIRGANFAKKSLHEYANKAKEFVEKSDDKPYFLMVNFPDSHFPVQRRVEGRPFEVLESDVVESGLPFVGINSERMKINTTNYYNCINRLDECVGMLLDSLNSCSTLENTVVFFISDHGAQFSRGKCSAYEGGVKIPMIVAHPGNLPQGETSNQLVSVIDLLPTFIAIAGGESPSNLPGNNLYSLMDGDHDQWREYLFTAAMGCTPDMHYPRRSVRDKRFKLIVNDNHTTENAYYKYYAKATGHFSAGTIPGEIACAPEYVQKAYDTWRNPPKYELYDLHCDPNEWHDLSGYPAYADILERMKSVLREWRIESGDKIVDPSVLQRINDEMNTIVRDNINYNKDDSFQYEYIHYLNPQN